MDRVVLQTAIFMFQYYHNLLPKAFDNYFTSLSSKLNLILPSIDANLLY